jgi:beta-galactosidase
MGWLDAELSEDFLKSLAPEKPYYDSEFHVCEDNKPTPDPAAAKAHLQTALWLAHLHGMSANLLWYWGRNPDGSPAGEWFKGSLLQQPWMLQGYAQETLSLRRFVRPVMAFSRQSHPVRLLYSEASAIQDVGYLDALRDSYEALNFLGVPIGFVTERRIAEKGIPADTKLLIVPDAEYVQDRTAAVVKAARAKGMAVALIGEKSLTMTPTGLPRKGAAVPGAFHLSLGTPQEYGKKLDARIRAAGIRRGLLALNADGHPAWGVEVRTAREGGRRFAYLVNLTRRPVQVKLRWRESGHRFRDLRAGSAVPDTLTLRPRQIVFGAY